MNAPIPKAQYNHPQVQGGERSDVLAAVELPAWPTVRICRREASPMSSVAGDDGRHRQTEPAPGLTGQVGPEPA
jgi:hypothetical protein